MLIAMAGLPASGKSTIAARLANDLHGVVLNKDEIRAKLFPHPVLDYSEAANDICMEAIFRAAVHIRNADPERTVILDGRTFIQSAQVDKLLTVAAALAEPVHIIECICSLEIVRQRLEADLNDARHPARNRTLALYESLQQKAAPLEVPHLTLDTGALTIDECVRRCLAYLRSRNSQT